MTDWQGAETAPRDGSTIIYYDAIRDAISLCRWDEGEWRDNFSEWPILISYWLPWPGPQRMIKVTGEETRPQ